MLVQKIKTKLNTHFLLGFLALVLIAGAAIKPAYAYFTARSAAQGGYTLELSNKTSLTETKVSMWAKHAVVTNNGSTPVFVRVAAFSGDAYVLGSESENWSDKSGDYYYYLSSLQPGESTSEIVITIGNVPEVADIGSRFQVILVSESVPVVYDAKGLPDANASWSMGTATFAN